MPILLMAVLGGVVRHIGPWDISFFRQLNKLAFRIFLPLSLFNSVYKLEDISDVNWTGILFLAACATIALLLGMIAARLFVPERRQKGVVIQASFRSNQAIMGLTLANTLGGEAAMGFAAMGTALMVPLFNTFAVAVLTYYSGDEGQSLSPAKLLRRIATNPLVLGGLSGVLAVVIRQFLPVVNGAPIFTISGNLPSVYKVISNLASVASPIMLFCLGTLLDFGAIKGILKPLTLGIVLRLVVCPAVILSIAMLLREPLHLTTAEFPTILAICSTPVAVSSSVMTQEIGGDEQLSAQLVVWSSVVSMGTIFGIICLLRTIGVL